VQACENAWFQQLLLCEVLLGNTSAMPFLRMSHLITLGTALLVLAASPSTAQTTRTDEQTKLSRTEAEILVYLMPVSQQLRRQGFDVGWEIRQDGDWLHFSVYNSKRKCKGCSATVGNYTVNASTATVTDDDLNKVVSGREMRGVKAILRRAHRIPESGPGQH